MESRGPRDERERADRYNTNDSSRIIRTAVGNIIPCELLDWKDRWIRSCYSYWCIRNMLNEIFGLVTPYLETTMERPMQNRTVEDGSNHDNDEDHEEVVARVDGEGRDIDAHDEVETDGVASRVEENDGSKEDGHVRFSFWSDSFLRCVIRPRDINKKIEALSF
eukprot:scaffold112761_cov46-Cyclotella_meneghiniana.AAC.6